MPTPPKPYVVLANEKKSHRTNAELNQRKEGEAELLTGVKMQIWPGMDKTGKEEFERVQSLLASIGKDDALYEGVVNRYAQLKSECRQYELMVKKLRASMRDAEEKYSGKEIDFLVYMGIMDKLNQNLNSCDRQIQAKRKMMLDIEKENVMTIASALRAIPKKVTKSEPKTGVGAFMAQRNGGGA